MTGKTPSRRPPDPTEPNTTYEHLASNRDAFTQWLAETFDVKALHPTTSWWQVTGVLIEVDVLWRSWRHAWSHEASLYDKKEWLEYLDRAQERVTHLVRSSYDKPDRVRTWRCADGPGGHSLGVIPAEEEMNLATAAINFRNAALLDVPDESPRC